MTAPQTTAKLAISAIKALKANGASIATVESCTGGLLAGALTSVSGASTVVHGGFITYANRAKTKMVGVQARLIKDYGAVSSQVARAMADGGRSAARTDLAISVTGIAGPDGGSAEKPIGLVYIACATADTTKVIEKRFGDLGRNQIRQASVAAALQLVIDTLATPAEN